MRLHFAHAAGLLCLHRLVLMSIPEPAWQRPTSQQRLGGVGVLRMQLCFGIINTHQHCCVHVYCTLRWLQQSCGAGSSALLCHAGMTSGELTQTAMMSVRGRRAKAARLLLLLAAGGGDCSSSSRGSSSCTIGGSKALHAAAANASPCGVAGRRLPQGALLWMPCSSQVPLTLFEQSACVVCHALLHIVLCSWRGVCG